MTYRPSSPLLDEPGKASIKNPPRGKRPSTPPSRSCGKAAAAAADQDEEEEGLKKAKAVVAELLQWGGIWNDVDDRNETPGCVALRLGRRDLYDMCVAAGMRAEMLFGLLGGYEELGSADDDDDEMMDDAEEEVEVEGDRDKKNQTEKEVKDDDTNKGDNVVVVEGEEEMDIEDFEKAMASVAANASSVQAASGDDHVVTSDAYLASELTYDPKKLVDDAGNGVMMAWETDIMRRSVISLLSEDAPSLVDTSGAATAAVPSEGVTPSAASDEVDIITSLPKGKRCSTLGSEWVIIDGLFASTKPSKHHIVEAHPAVLSYINTSPDSKFGPAWVDAAEDAGANKVWGGRWQDICPKLLADGEIYDAIYFDTFGEDYSQLKLFFTDYIPGLLEQDGKFSFFNGLGADRKICYDVYQRVVEMHLSDAGMDAEWEEIDVNMQGMGEDGKGEWEGVVRRYWTLDKYQLPTCSFLG